MTDGQVFILIAGALGVGFWIGYGAGQARILARWQKVQNRWFAEANRCMEERMADMNLMRCEWCCGTQPGVGVVQVKHCPRCQSNTWHYRADQFERLKVLDGDQLERAVLEIQRKEREGAKV